MSETPLNPPLGICLKNYNGHSHPKTKALLALVLYLKTIHLTLYVRYFSVRYDKTYGHDIAQCIFFQTGKIRRSKPSRSS